MSRPMAPAEALCMHEPAIGCPSTLFHASPSSNGFGITEQGLDPARTGQNSDPDAGDAVFLWTTREAAETMIRDAFDSYRDEGAVLDPEWDIWQVDATGLKLYADPEFEWTAELSAVYALELIDADRLEHVSTLVYDGPDEDNELDEKQRAVARRPTWRESEATFEPSSAPSDRSDKEADQRCRTTPRKSSR